MKKVRFVYIAILLLMSMLCQAQDVRYYYKPLEKGSCRVAFTADGIPHQRSILVKITADKGITFSAKPEMTLWTADGDSLKLTGKNLNVVDVKDGKYKHGITGVYGYARFAISDEQIEKLGDGVKAIRLTTMPWIHEREFTKDKLGRKLYYALTK